ncbi:MAG: hypothetical protein KJ952_03285 [Candidatus Omnitrophica bacterium]|nr:hypothetical protein [Candidatus Omnitrophota bacterium]
MKIALQIHKIIISIFMLTLLALLYVNQQTLIYQIGLNLKENNKIYSELLDHNRILVYNVLNLKSPVNLEAKLLAKEVELSMPHKWQVVKRDNSPAKFVHKDETKRGLFANLFIMGREAEASPNINNGFSLKRH